jgi:cell division protein FtsL
MSRRVAASKPPRVLWAGHALSEGQRTARFHRERDRRRLRAMARGLLGAGLVVALVLSVVGLRLQQVRLSYQLDGLRTREAELDETRSRLRVELYSLQSLARIESKARTELGMIPPARDQVLLAREFVSGGGGLSAVAPLTASTDERARQESGAR